MDENGKMQKLSGPDPKCPTQPAPENRIHGLPLCRPSVLAFGRRLGHLIEATELTPQITTDHHGWPNNIR